MMADAPWVIPGHIESRGGRLFIAGHEAAALAAERGAPLLILNARRIVETVRSLKLALAAEILPVTICYASKALSAIKVLRLLRQEGVAIEVNSGGELFRAKTAGFAADKIVFNGVAKSEAEIAAALDPPIKAINVDSLFELGRIAAVARGMDVQARVALRIVPGVESPTSAGNQTGAEGTKFGILLRELPAALALLREARDRLHLVGIHAHVGSQIGSVTPYREAARMLAGLKAGIEGDLQVALEHINIGGGFPIPYMRGVAHTPQDDIFAPRIDTATAVHAALAELLSAGLQNTEIVIEPGRSLVGDAGILLSRAENVKDRFGEPWLVLDAGYNVLVESYTYKWYYHALSAAKLDEPGCAFRLAGPLCDNGDAFFDVEGEATVRRLLNAEPALAAHRALLEAALIRLPPTRSLAASTGPGDLLAFLDCGAYVLDQMTPNNGRPRPEVGLIGLDGDYGVLRRRDSYDDLLSGEVL